MRAAADQIIAASEDRHADLSPEDQALVDAYCAAELARRRADWEGAEEALEDAEDELQARMQAIGVPTIVPGETGALTARE